MALGYKVALTNVWWNRGGQDTRLFSTISEQQTYFTNLGLYYNELNNFNINDNITTTIIFRDKSGRSISDLLKCNYAIVWNTIANSYRYYFVIDIKQDSNNQVQVALELDDIQTNLVPNLSNIGNVLVKRWTGLNYKVDNNNDKYYSFDYNKLSFLNDDNTALQYNKASNELIIKHFTSMELNRWLSTNIKCWQFVFVVDNHQLESYGVDADDSLIDVYALAYTTTQGTNVNKLPYGAISVPLYKTNKRIYIKYAIGGGTTRYCVLKEEALGEFFSIAQNSPIGKYGIEEKVSNVCPLSVPNFEIDNDGDLILEGQTYYADTSYGLSLGDNYYLASKRNENGANTDKAHALNVCCGGYKQLLTTFECEASHSLDTNNLSNKDNAKILDKGYSKLRIRIANQHYDYNPLSLINSANDNTLKFYYTEVLKAGVSKIYLRAKANGLYTEAQEKDFTGLIASLDLTEPILNNQWADYFANHKNYYMQTAFNNTIGLVKGLSATAGGVATGFKYGGYVGGGIAGAIGLGQTGFNLLTNIVNQELDKDNMQQAPDSLSNANGDPYFYNAVSTIKPILDTFQVESSTRNAILENWERNGVEYNRVFSFSEVIYSHKSYDALSIIIDKVSSNLSIKEFTRLRSLMSELHRYWYTDNFDNDNPYIL